MGQEQRNGSGRRCPACGRGSLRPRWVDERFSYEHNGFIYDVETKNVPLEDCDQCFETFIGPAAARIRHDSLGRALGLLAPSEITAIRTSAGWSVEEFARIIGADPEKVSRWERGRLWQDLATDKLIRLLGSDRHILNRLHDNRTSTIDADPDLAEGAGSVIESPVSYQRPGRGVELD